MDWFNYYGLIIMLVIMFPNIVYAAKHKENASERVSKFVTIAENISRYGCMFFIVFNLPDTWFGYFFLQGEIVYPVVNGILLCAYCIVWGVMWKRDNLISA